MGCKYDVMMSAWVPEDCYDQEASEEFRESGIVWYADRGGTIEVPLSVVATGDYDLLYTSVDFHFKHCSYLWMKQIRALVERKPIDNYS